MSPARPTASAAVVTVPPIHRGSMTALPWRGFVASLRAAATRAEPAAAPPVERRDWQHAARRRRAALLAVVAMLSVLAAALWHADGAAPGDAGPGAVQALQLLLMTSLFGWVGIGVVTAAMGAWVMWRGDHHALRLRHEHAPIDAGARTAIVMPICNEDVATVVAGLRRTCESLAATGALRLFDVYILSDTRDAALRAAELRAWAALREQLGDDAAPGAGARIFYRWRRRRSKRKAGNVADFCRRWGRDYRYMVVLDADSTMRGDTLVQLVRLMEAHPRAGIVQTLPMAAGPDTLHARAQRFATGVVGRLFAQGMAYWQLGDAHYWGHNAIIRVEPFMRHCALAPLPGRGALGGDILSHDFVEAALMRRAGYEVWLAPRLGGSWEQLPANLLDELQRDRRWCHGNLQNARLIAEPGWQPAHRAMFAVGAFSYAVAPLWLAFVALGLWQLGSGVATGAAALWTLTLALLLMPRLLGVVAVITTGRAREFGGPRRLVTGAGFELLLSALQAPVRMLAHTAFVLAALTGWRLEWKSPPRAAQSLRWRDAARQLGAPVLGAATALLLVAGPAPQLLPLLLPWLLAVPLVVWTSRGADATARWLRLPGERPLVESPTSPAKAAEVAGHRTPWLPAAVAAAFVAAVMLPRAAVSPELPAPLRAELELQHLAQVELRRLSHQAATQAGTPVPRLRYLASPQPARFIDDAVRQRARDYVLATTG